VVVQLHRLPSYCLLLIALSASPVLADDASPPSIPVSAPATKMASAALSVDDGDENVDRAFNTPTDDGRPGEYFFALGAQAVRKGDYVHAIAMYKVAASWAYKPAQYNLGVMYLNGQGTTVDLPRALAWMALAAERDDANYVRARQLVYTHLTPAQYEQANAIYRELLPTYADTHALPRAMARWRQARADATGSRVGSSAAPVKVGGADGTLSHMNSPNYDMHDGGHIVSSPSDLTGGHAADGAIAYQALRSTDNPYDPKVMPVTGQATVGPLSQVSNKDGDGASHKDDQTSHP